MTHLLYLLGTNYYVAHFIKSYCHAVKHASDKCTNISCKVALVLPQRQGTSWQLSGQMFTDLGAYPIRTFTTVTNSVQGITSSCLCETVLS